MDRSKIKKLDAEYIVHTYNRYDVVADHAYRATITDVNGKEFIDLCSGYGANSLGYGHKAWLDAVKAQFDQVQHTSNLYYTAPGPQLAEKLATRSGLCKVWFANSGGEANEAAIKVARKYGNTLADHKKNTIISLKKSFHGRTLATVTATGLAEAQESFGPLVPGFVHAEVDDAAELEKLVKQYDPCAFLMELVQGEGGVHALEQSFVDKAAELCEKNDILFIDDDVQVGIMVETPSAAVMTPVLAKYVDFFSIGTNDLVQYTLACDRGNANISYLYNHFNPSVLRLIQRTIQSARDNGIWAGMCGEMASDPYAAVLLMGMGIHELSMSAPSIPRVKEMLRKTSSVKAKEVLADVMKLEDGDEIREYLHKVL